MRSTRRFRAARGRPWLAVSAPLILALVLLLSACTDEGGTGEEGGGDGEGGQAQQQGTGDTLQRVQDREQLVCGVNDAVPGFGFVTPEGTYEGFDVDVCRAVATAVLGDPEAVEYRPLTTEQRFTALQAGEVDLLSRNTTYTVTRDTAEGARFLHTTFYDGAGMMVPADSPYQQISDMNGTVICVLSGTTNEQVLATEFGRRNIQHEPLSFEDNEQLHQALREGRCDGWTSDKSQLAGVRSAWPADAGGPDALRLLDETMSKEPLSPAVRDGDDQWAAIVDWTVYALIQAEEFGVTSQNVQQMVDNEDPSIAQFLGGGEADFDDGLGLEPGWTVNVIEAVGNYGEIYDRNIGGPLELERGLNALWTDGGLHYAPPYR